MGAVTPNMSIYIPAAGETNYDAPFSAGMINIDQHNHTGGPNNGVLLTGASFSPGSVTYTILNANVADNATGIGTHTGGLANQLYLLGILASIFQNATPTGLLAKNGSTASAVTITGTANKITVTNGDGSGGNPTLTLPATIYANISFDSGTTTLNSYNKNTFTPTIALGGSSAGMVYINQNGTYWQIGSVIYYFIDVALSMLGGGSGNVTIEGLPFASASDSTSCVPSVFCEISTYPAGTTYITGAQNTGGTNIMMYGCGAATSSALQDTNLSNTSFFRLSGFYWIA
jgi:hypothetical protein